MIYENKMNSYSIESMPQTPDYSKEVSQRGNLRQEMP